MLGASDCEAIVAGFLGQPANAVSSLAFVLAGIVVMVRVRTIAGWLMAGALVFAGAGSVLYHGPMPSWAEILHDLGILSLVAALGATLLPVLVRRKARQGLVRRLALPLVLLALAAVALVLGRTGGPWCRPEVWWQAHAAWHLLAASGLGGVALVAARATRA